MANGSGEDPVVTAPANKATGYGIVAAAQTAGRVLFSAPEVLVGTGLAVVDFIKFMNSIETNTKLTPTVAAARKTWKELQTEDPGLPNVVIADLHWYSTTAFRVTKNEAVRDLWAAGYDAWTNSSALVLVSEKLQEKYDEDPLLAKILLRHEAMHVRQFIQFGRPSTYLAMVKFEADAYTKTRDELAAADFPEYRAGIAAVVTFFEKRLTLTTATDADHRAAMVAEGYLPATAGDSPANLYLGA